MTRLAVVTFAATTSIAIVAWTTSASTARALPQDPNALTGYEIVLTTTESSSYDVQSTSAKCSPGKRVLGGGASILGSPGASVFWNGPARTTSTGSWAAAAHELRPTPRRWSLEVYAICASIGTGR